MPSADASLAATLRDVAAATTEPFVPAERAILAIGERLCDASDALGRLTSVFETLPHELDHEDVRDTMQHLGAVAGTLSGIAGTLADERAALEDLAERAKSVGERAQRLHKTVAAVSVLAVNARIAAAHIEAEREDFSIFTVEIARLTATASGTIDRFAHELERLGGQLRSAAASQGAFERAHGADLRAAAARLEACLDAVRRRRDQAAAAAREIGTRSRRIAEGVSAAVRSLQIGDITRQRAEHVGHALEVLAGALAQDGDGGWSAALSEEQRAAVVSAVCRLQSTQAGRAAAEFEHEIRSLTMALLGLADESRAITGLGDRLYGAAQQGAGTSFLADLAAELGKAEALMGTCGEARAEVDRVAETASRSLASLVTEIEAVRGIEVDMRLVGLNTALKCGRLGTQGRTLSVIAQELRTYANHTVEDAQAVMAGLREVVGAAEALHRRGVEQSASRMALLGQETAAAVARLDAIGAGLSAALATLEGEGGRVARVLADTAAGITLHEEVGRALRAAAQRLDALAASEAGGDENAEVVRERVLAVLKGHYTMASERDIHDLFTGAETVAGHDPPNVPLAGKAEANVDDLLF
ncbi:hypothetical protein [Azospirillum sp.]|uniref:hypothetical protein n=1 Tax=Azospirillum sp. TaxID=34012 RepID=UPI002D54BE90|nr:hypothetical protein [Azospirillum sp.]HYD68933.1 hypothetical protein [Azospirillum sp.]